MNCKGILNNYRGDTRKLFTPYFLIMLARLGMVIIIISRLIQLNYSRKGRKELQIGFLLLQALGIFLLVISSFAAGDGRLGFLNLLSAGGAIRVYLKIKK